MDNELKDSHSQRFVFGLGLLLFLQIAAVVAFIFCLSGCATMIKTPCLSTAVPKPVKLGLYLPPKTVEAEDGSNAVIMVAVPESVKEFFSYVQTLEKIADEAVTCHK